MEIIIINFSLNGFAAAFNLRNLLEKLGGVAFIKNFFRATLRNAEVTLALKCVRNQF